MIFFPGELSLDFNYDETDIDTVFQFSDDLQAHDLFLYVEDEIKVNERLKMNLGTHLAPFSQLKIAPI